MYNNLNSSHLEVVYLDNNKSTLYFNDSYNNETKLSYTHGKSGDLIG